MTDRTIYACSGCGRTEDGPDRPCPDSCPRCGCRPLRYLRYDRETGTREAHQQVRARMEALFK